MKILVLNGSPRGKKSTTMQITDAFIKGIKKPDDQIEIVHLVNHKVSACRGCYCCWTNTPGKCVIKDDGVWILEHYLQAELVIWSSPLYSFGLTSIAKAMLDRLLPVYQPIIEERKNGQVTHPFRFDLQYQKYVLISGCGFYAYENNYESLEKQFQILYGDKYTSIICTEGELFRFEELRFKTNIYLEMVTKAGKEYRENGAVSEELEKRLRERHFVPKKYVDMANNSWDIKDDTLTEEEKLRIKARNIVVQMGMTFDEEKMNNKLIIEFLFQDCGYRCQMILDHSGCEINDDVDTFEKDNIRFVTTVKKWTQVTKHGLLRRRGERSEVREQSGFQYLVDFALSLDKNKMRKEIKVL